ncbi:MAG TPA: prenyltransferase/squalene oxidase repeat-containing protein, partial [Planctomycetota bacterium]|nr:prenyltransferase/squalene oxidase repeat-containing protein [Planctomycetota bacterium]
RLRPSSSDAIPGLGQRRDPEVLQALEEARAFEEAARGNPVRYAEVKTRWKQLETRFWGTPEHALFRERLTAFEDFVCEEANKEERRVVGEAQALLREDRPLEALARLLCFPQGLAGTPAGLRLAPFREDIRSQFVRRFREGLQTAVDLAASERFQEAKRQVRQLRLILPPAGAGEASELGKPYRDELESRLRRLDEEESLARTRLAQALEAGKGVPVPRGVPEEGPTPAKVGSEPGKDPAAPITPLEALRRAILEGTPDCCEAARAMLKSRLGVSPVYRAADLLLARGLAAWNFTEATQAAFLKYLSGLAPGSPERLSPAEHRIQVSALADLVSSAKGKGAEALTLFACAHLESLMEAGEAVDPPVAEAAGLHQGSVLVQWGPAASVSRVELARLLVSPPGVSLSRTGTQASFSPAFPERVLGLLCSTREGLDASAAEGWKKLGGGAPEASWARMAETVADRIRLSMSCEGCGGQGRAVCPSCVASGTTACASCTGSGYTLDDDGGKVTCSACKGRGQVLCAVCSGSKTIRCSSCDGKKMKVQVPGGLFRYLAELGLCEACGGSGSYFAQVLYPCPRCDGTGRSWAEIPKEFAKLPPWLKGQSGCACFNALRWLARHQAPDGSWAPTQWTSRCSGPGCEAAPASEYAVGVTSLALAAFLAAGVGPRSDLKPGGLVSAGDLVRKSISWLEAHQEPSGLIRLGESDHSVLEHEMAAWALSMALLMTGPAGSPAAEVERANLREAAQRAIRQTLALEQKEGGWSAAPGGPVDTWTTSWSGLALLTARDAGLEVPRAILNGILNWLSSVTDAGDLRVKLTPDQTDKLDLAGTESFSDHPTLSASGAFLRLVLEGKPAAGTLAAERFLSRDLPAKEENARDYSYWTWGTLFMAQRTQRRGALWTVWSGALFRELLPLQESRGTCALGAFPPSDRWGTIGGTVYATAMNAITLDIAIASKVLLKSR